MSIEVPFVIEDTLTFYLTSTASSRPAIQVISPELKLAFYRSNKMWVEITTNKIQNNELNKILNAAYTKLKQIQKQREII